MLHLLDIPHLILHGARLEVAAMKPALLLCYLALQGNWVSRGALATLVSPEADEESARHRVRVLLNRAKTLPWAAALEIENTRVRFQMPVDVQAFREAMGRADWRRALEVYRRPLLEDFPVSDEGLSTWFSLERERLETAWFEAAQGRATELSAEGDHRAAAAIWQDCLHHDPLQEAALRGYLRAAYLSQQREAALEAFARFQTLLKQELRLSPTAETLALVQLIETAEPLEALPEASAVPVSLLQPPQLIGRAGAATQLRRSRAQVMVITGEPGVGKTRFLSELQPLGTWIRGIEGLQGVNYAPLLTLARQTTDVLERLGAYRDDLLRLLPELAANTPLDAVDAVGGHARLLEGFARLLESQASPVLVDDLQWLDAATLEALTYALSRGRLQLYATLRREEITPELTQLLRAWRAESLTLEPLDLTGTEHLVSSLVGVNTGFPVFSRWLFERTGGNIFFALEVLKNLFETGRLRVQGQSWSSVLDNISQDYAEFDVPTSVNDLVLHRIETLPLAVQRLVQAASVLGQGFDLATLETLTELPHQAALDALEAAELAGVLTPQGFRHDLLRQSVYAQVSQARRRVLHTRAANAASLEPLRRAEHWLQAGETKHALPLLLEAGHALKRRGLLPEARRVLERVLQLDANHLPTLAAVASIAAQLGDMPLARAYSQRVLRTPEADALTRAQALNAQASLLYSEGRIADAAPLIEEALRLSAPLERDDADIEETAFDIFEAQERYEDALALLQPAMTRLRQHGDSGALAMCLSSLAGIYDDTERYTEALELHREALTVAKRAGAGYAQVNAALQMMWGLRNANRAEEALVICEEALLLGEYSNTEYLRNALGASLMHLSRFPEAIHVYEHNAQHGNITTRALAWGRLAGLYAHTGQLETSRNATSQAVQCALQTQVFFAQMRAAIAALRFGTPDEVTAILPLVQGKRSPDTVSQLEFEAAFQAWQQRQQEPNLG